MSKFKCLECGKLIDEDVEFCPYCGVEYSDEVEEKELDNSLKDEETELLSAKAVSKMVLKTSSVLHNLAFIYTCLSILGCLVLILSNMAAIGFAALLLSLIGGFAIEWMSCVLKCLVVLCNK